MDTVLRKSPHKEEKGGGDIYHQRTNKGVRLPQVLKQKWSNALNHDQKLLILWRSLLFFWQCWGTHAAEMPRLFFILSSCFLR